MGRTIGKTCARCGRLNYVDVDAEMFTCPGCGARVEIYDEDREVVDKAMEKIIVPGKKESHLYEKAEKKPWGILIFCLILIVIGFLVYQNRDRFKPKDLEQEDKERVNNNLTNLLSYFSFPYRGELNGATYEVEYDIASSSFIVRYKEGKVELKDSYPDITYQSPDTLRFGNDTAIVELKQVITKNANDEDVHKARLKVFSYNSDNTIFEKVGNSKIDLERVEKNTGE